MSHPEKAPEKTMSDSCSRSVSEMKLLLSGVRWLKSINVTNSAATISIKPRMFSGAWKKPSGTSVREIFNRNPEKRVYFCFCRCHEAPSAVSCLYSIAQFACEVKQKVTQRHLIIWAAMQKRGFYPHPIMSK